MLTDDILNRVRDEKNKQYKENSKNMKTIDKLIISEDLNNEEENKNINKKKLFKKLETVKIKSNTQFKLELMEKEKRNLNLIEKAQLNLEIKKKFFGVNDDKNINNNENENKNENVKKKYKRSLTTGNKTILKEKILDFSDDEEDENKNLKKDNLKLDLNDYKNEELNLNKNKEKFLTIQEPLKTYSNYEKSSFKKKKFLNINDFQENDIKNNPNKINRKFKNSKTLKLESNNEMTKEIISNIKSKKVKFIDESHKESNKKSKKDELEKYLLNDD